MSAIVFGSEEAAAVQRIDRARDELERMAKERWTHDFYVPLAMLSGYQRAIAEYLCLRCGWEKVDESEDGVELISYRPPNPLLDQWHHERNAAVIDEGVFDVVVS